MKDATRIRETKIFSVLMEVSIRLWINKEPHLSATVYDSIKNFADIKEDMHNVYLRAWRDLDYKWTTLSFISVDEVVFAVVNTWPPEWRTPNVVVHNEVGIRKQKVVAKKTSPTKVE